MNGNDPWDRSDTTQPWEQEPSPSSSRPPAAPKPEDHDPEPPPAEPPERSYTVILDSPREAGRYRIVALVLCAAAILLTPWLPVISLVLAGVALMLAMRVRAQLPVRMIYGLAAAALVLALVSLFWLPIYTLVSAWIGPGQAQQTI